MGHIAHDPKHLEKYGILWLVWLVLGLGLSRLAQKTSASALQSLLWALALDERDAEIVAEVSGRHPHLSLCIGVAALERI